MTNRLPFPVALLATLALAGCAPRPAPTPATQAAPWEAEIRQFELADRQHPPAPGGVVFTGSSSIRMWEGLAEDFPGTRVLNRGFGGSQLEDVLRYADRIILPYRPRLVLVYAGDNDLAAGKSPQRVLADYRALVERIHRALPEARIGFISIKPSPSRWELAPQMRAANALVRDYSAGDPRLLYIDVFTPMLGPDGRPREELFRDDRLHMNERGYELWRSIVAPYLRPPGPGAGGLS